MAKQVSTIALNAGTNGDTLAPLTGKDGKALMELMLKVKAAESEKGEIGKTVSQRAGEAYIGWLNYFCHHDNFPAEHAMLYWFKLRDAKVPTGPTLSVRKSEWQAMRDGAIAAHKNGRTFDAKFWEACGNQQTFIARMRALAKDGNLNDTQLAEVKFERTPQAANEGDYLQEMIDAMGGLAKVNAKLFARLINSENIAAELEAARKDHKTTREIAREKNKAGGTASLADLAAQVAAGK